MATLLDIAQVNGLAAALAAGGGLTPRAFDPVVAFDVNFAETTTQSADIALTLAASPVDFVNGLITIVGDGTHACTFPTDWVNANGQTFDNRSRNNIWLIYDGHDVEYSIVTAPTPDVTPPVLVSAVVENAAPTMIVLTYSEPLDTTSVPVTGDFSCNLSKAVTAVSIAGSQVTVTVNSAYINGDAPTISYTAGGNPIQDPSHNHAANLVNQVVTNNVLAGSQSISVIITNQICKTISQPTNLAFGSGGTDTPMSVSFWLKRSNITGATIAAIGTPTVNYGYTTQIDSAGVLYFQLFGAGAIQMYIFTNVGISSGVWTHVTLTYTGSLLASGMKIYINGTLAATTVGISSYPGQAAFVSGVILAVMGGNDNTQVAANVLVDSFYNWNTDLSGGQITALYNGGTLIDPTTLAFYSNLNVRYEFDGNILDQGPYGYDMSSITAPSYSTDHP